MTSLAPLDLTHVVYDASSIFSLGLALLTLSPILLMAAYASLAVFTRELTIINMWAGQLLCEALNWFIKHIVKQERPYESIGNGFGFPSSHSQYMAYFATFLILHVCFRHRLSPTGSSMVDSTIRMCVLLGLLLWSAVVAYSRFHLGYHSASQVLWGVAIGVLFSITFYLVVELIPVRNPRSLLGQLRTKILSNPVSEWFRLRDGWLVWDDCGKEMEWQEWRKQLEKKKQ